MHPFMASVLLWPPRRDALGKNAQSNPPDGELRQTSDTEAGERGAIVSAESLRQAVVQQLEE